MYDLGFENVDEIEFFRKLDWIIEYNSVKDLSEEEIMLLPEGAKMMTLECGMRFLTDHLQNDVYFKIHRENHNLDRCRTQFKLVADMESKWQEMNSIIENNKMIGKEKKNMSKAITVENLKIRYKSVNAYSIKKNLLKRLILTSIHVVV